MYGRARIRVLGALFGLVAAAATPGQGPGVHQGLKAAIEESFDLKAAGLPVQVAALEGDPDGSYRATVEAALRELGRVRIAESSQQREALVEGSFRVRPQPGGDRLVCYLALTLGRDGSKPWVLLTELPLDPRAVDAGFDLGALLRRHGMPLGVGLVLLSAMLAAVGLGSSRGSGLHPIMAEAARVLDRTDRSLWWVRAAAQYKPELALIRTELADLTRELLARPDHHVRVEGLGFKDEERRAVLYLENRIAHLAAEVGEIGVQMGETLRPATGSPELARTQLDGVRRRLAEVRESLERRRTTLGSLMA